MPQPPAVRLPRSRSRALLTAIAVGLGSVAWSACGLQLSTGIEAKSTWSRSYKVGDAATLDLREPNGKINVEAVDGNEIKVTATRIAKASTEEAAKAEVEKIEIREKATAELVEIDSTPPTSINFGYSRRVDYDVKIPRSASLTIKTSNGDIDVKAIGGRVKIEATNGEITASGLERGAEITATNGSIELDLSKVGTDGVRCHTTNGQIIVTIPKSAKATLAARVTNGVIDVDNLPVEFTEQSRRRLDASLGGGGPEIRLDTTNGYIKINGR